MSKTQDVIEGMIIIDRYYDKEGYHIWAEHDEIGMYPINGPMLTKDIERLLELNWFQRNNGDMVLTDYDPEESWMTDV